jgi:hypothetical protein
LTSHQNEFYTLNIFHTDNNSEDDLQDLDITKTEKLDRKRRDLSSTDNDEIDEIDDDEKKTEVEETESAEESKIIEKRSDEEETAVSGVENGSELLEGSENSDDVKRRTRQLRPSIISSPWRVSSGASYRAIDFAPNSFGSSLNNFPTATSGLLYKSDGRFYPTNNFKSSEEFNPVISSYNGGNKNKFSAYNSYSGESGERSQEAPSKYKQSSKISGSSPSSSLFPLLFSYDSYNQKSKVTTARPVDNNDNYSYFHIGKQAVKPDKLKTYAFPVTNLPSTTPRNPFASFGGFFNNNNQQSSNQGFLPLKPVSKYVTPAPIYEGAKSASSFDSRYTTPSSLKATPSTPYANNPFLNNLAFNNPSPSLYSFGPQDSKKDEKVVQITTKKPTFTQYPIPSSTPKYMTSYTTPHQLFDFDKFVAGIRETQKLQNGGQNQNQKFAGINNLSNNNHSAGNIRFQQIFNSPSTTTASPDEYYYDDEEEEETPQIDYKLNKFKTQTAKPSINTFNRKPVISTNLASEDDFYYDDDEEDEEEDFQPRPPPINKSKYTPMTETMAPRPMNVTTVRSYYVSGHTFSTPPTPTSTHSLIESAFKFPDDVFQGIRPFTSPAPNVISSNKYNARPNKNYEITKSTTTSTTEPTTTKRTKILKLVTKAPISKYVQQTSPTTAKPPRQTTKRKTYTIRPNRGNLKFNKPTKRPDKTRLEIDEKSPNR